MEKSIIFIENNDLSLDLDLNEKVVRYEYGNQIVVEHINGFTIVKHQVTFDGREPVFIFSAIYSNQGCKYYLPLAFPCYHAVRYFCLSHSSRHTPSYYDRYAANHREFSFYTTMLDLYKYPSIYVKNSVSV